MNLRLKSFLKALLRLEEALRKPPSDLYRDAAIQRFEFCFELSWKAVQGAARRQGQDCPSPKACLQAAFRNGWIEKEKPWLAALEDRNLTSHTYVEKLAKQVRSRLPKYVPMFRALAQRLKSLED